MAAICSKVKRWTVKGFVRQSLLEQLKVSYAEYTEFHIDIVLASEQGGSIAAALHPGLAPFLSLLRRFPHLVIPALTERTAIAILAPPFFRRHPCRRILACIPRFG
ncbi:hypothetical protein BN1044_04019 [Hafnia alvei]|uniref:Uncharacterized protein n=1 Tax=Hafnia alvei TaxID=569 RepID=A0A1C6Z5Z6_HAFAL|nr:hypothetical protein BN1044_04019 [Hafnia alvei]